MSRKAELLPCPFCGAELYRWRTFGGASYWHPDNGCVIFAVAEGLDGAKDYKDWNRRVSNENEK